MLGKVAMAILLIFLLLGVFATPINDGIKTWRTDDTTESFTADTAAGVGNANVTLSYDLFQAETAEVIAVTSNVTGDSPVANAYTEDTKVLNLTGLQADKVRTVEVNYYSEDENVAMRAIGPFLAMLLFGFLLLAVVWGAVGDKIKNRHR